MARNKTVLLRCTLEDGKISRKPGERASLPEALAKSLAGLGLVEILDSDAVAIRNAAEPRNGSRPAAAQTPPASAPDGGAEDRGSGDAGADADADSADAGKEDEANG